MLIIVKFGGSVITDKSKAGVIREDVIEQLAKTIASVNLANCSLIIVHGAGSLGHPEAAAYGIAHEVTRANAHGVVVTHAAVSSLNMAVVSTLQKFGVDAVPFHPISCALAKNGRLVDCGEEQIKCLLSVGLVPVLHGDVVMDTENGGCIVSGDQIVPTLAKSLHADGVCVVTATGGVLDAEGNVIPKITRDTFPMISFEAGEISKAGDAGEVSAEASDEVSGKVSDEAPCADVTGGMQSKVLELLELADSGIPAHIIKPEMLAAFLEGKDFLGTVITK